jgi:hypothetical protein
VGSGNIDIAQIQLCAGSEVLPFEPKSYGHELRDCQRYFLKLKGGYYVGAGFNRNATSARHFAHFPVTLRTASATFSADGVAGNYQVNHGATSTVLNALPTVTTEPNGAYINAQVASGLTAGQGSALYINHGNGGLNWDAEL